MPLIIIFVQRKNEKFSNSICPVLISRTHCQCTSEWKSHQNHPLRQPLEARHKDSKDLLEELWKKARINPRRINARLGGDGQGSVDLNIETRDQEARASNSLSFPVNFRENSQLKGYEKNPYGHAFDNEWKIGHLLMNLRSFLLTYRWLTWLPSRRTWLLLWNISASSQNRNKCCTPLDSMNCMRYGIEALSANNSRNERKEHAFVRGGFEGSYSLSTEN